MDCKLGLFDWNGTLFEDTRERFKADCRTIKVFGGYPPSSLKVYRELAKIPVIDFYVACGCDRALLERDKERESEIFHNAYESLTRQCPTRRNGKRVLGYLRQHDIGRVIISNHPWHSLIGHLQRLRLEELFKLDCVLANGRKDTAFMEKNKLERLQEFLEQSGRRLTRHDFVAGDTEEEAEIGRALGITSILITGGTCSKARLKAAKPDYLINNLIEIIQIIEGK